jgi:cysteine synthase
VPENFSQEKVTIMRALGAEVDRTPDAEGMQGAIRRAKDFVATNKSARISRIRIITTKPLRWKCLSRWMERWTQWFWDAARAAPLPG